VKYAIRIPANENLPRDIEELLKRPAGRPSKKPLVEYKGFLYQAESWRTGGRLVKHARYYWLLLAESHLTRRLFASMLGRTDGRPLPSG